MFTERKRSFIRSRMIIIKLCETKTCQNCKSEFVIEKDDFGFYEKMQVPPPTFCPECRLQRRLAWRNERGLHHRECNLCGKRLFLFITRILTILFIAINVGGAINGKH